MRKLFVLLGALSLTVTYISAEELSQPKYAVVEDLDVRVPMRDGIRLRTEVYRPDSPGVFPVILRVTPYEIMKSEAEEFAKRGYVYVYQYARGRLGSEGFFYPYVQEGEDAFDTLQWIASQPWCNGKVGMSGGSSEAFCQFAVGVIGHPILRAMVPFLPDTDLYNVYFRQGAFELSMAHWAAGMYAPYRWDRKLFAAQFDSINRSVPLIDQDEIIGWPIPLLRDMVAHPAYDAYWRKITLGNRMKKVKMPMYIVSGWFDVELPGVLKTFVIMTGSDVPQSIRKNKRLIIGPWTHALNKNGVQGDMDFGKNGVFLFDTLYVRFSLPWFDYYLKGKQTIDIDAPPIRLFVMSANEWRNEHEWPLARTRFEKHYFHSSGHANSSQGNGSLSARMPQDEPSDRFLYDPLQPVPSYTDTSGLSASIMFGFAPSDHSRVAEREDMLVYTSEQFQDDIEVTGPIQVILYASSSTKTTDFTANLCDVYPDGRSIRLCEGIIRATHRNGPEKLSFIEPGKVYEYNIDLIATSNVFKKGHRIRVEISSSNFPRFDRNLNTALNNALATEMVKAEQTIFHSKEYPSCIVLPVIPQKSNMGK
jgi:uncharacterized protein